MTFISIKRDSTSPMGTSGQIIYWFLNQRLILMILYLFIWNRVIMQSLYFCRSASPLLKLTWGCALKILFLGFSASYPRGLMQENQPVISKLSKVTMRVWGFTLFIYTYKREGGDKSSAWCLPLWALPRLALLDIFLAGSSFHDMPWSFS